jgi:hypothetical protein
VINLHELAEHVPGSTKTNVHRTEVWRAFGQPILHLAEGKSLSCMWPQLVQDPYPTIGFWNGPVLSPVILHIIHLESLSCYCAVIASRHTARKQLLGPLDEEMVRITSLSENWYLNTATGNKPAWHVSDSGYFSWSLLFLICCFRHAVALLVTRRLQGSDELCNSLSTLALQSCRQTNRQAGRQQVERPIRLIPIGLIGYWRLTEV